MIVASLVPPPPRPGPTQARLSKKRLRKSTGFRSKVYWATVPLLTLLLVGCGLKEPLVSPTEQNEPASGPELIPPIGDGTQPSWTAVSRFFSPWIYQNWDDQQDFLSVITFDQDWNALNNWENTYAYPKIGRVYVSMVEDQNRYFIYYGTFHPRDWCSFPSDGCIPPGLGLPFNHENDMEGAFVVIDKRFTTPAWPYGQILTVQTVYHHSPKIYQNCSLEGGYSLYVAPDPNFKPSWDGCIPFAVGMAYGYFPPEQTTPSPAKRFNMNIQEQGHGVTLGVGHLSIYYYPTNLATVEPPTWRGVEWASPYSLQGLNQPEFQGASFWSRRLYVSNLPFVTNLPVGPHDVYYLWVL